MKANHNNKGQLIVEIPSRWYRKDTPTQPTDCYDTAFTEAEYLYDGWVPVTYPQYNSETEKLGGYKEIKDAKGKLTGVTFHVVPKTTEEIESEILSQSESDRNILMQRLMEDEIIVKAQSFDDGKALEMKSLYPFWEPDLVLLEGNKLRRFVDRELRLYKVKVGKGHTSQKGWAPESTESLFTRVGFDGGSLPPWSSTAASAGEYTLGYKVSHEGKNWESTFAGANAWKPGDHGWKVIA